MAWKSSLSKNLQELRILLSQTSAGSQGARDFVLASYQELKKANPNFPLLVREAQEAKATLVARYDFGKEVAVDVDGKSSGDIATHLQELVKAGDAMPRVHLSMEEEGVDAHVDAQRKVFDTYRCTSLPISIGQPHPGDIAEPSSLSQGSLSRLQLEGVLYACTKHLQLLATGHRAGFFLADGAGVGKGRQIAAIILDNYARGRRRHVWLSISTDLYLDACRDLRDLGCEGIKVINNCQTLDAKTKALGLSKDYQEGVLFMTYSTLTSSGRGKSRLEQVIQWVGGPDFDGCIILDESHKAKHFVPGKESQSTRVATCVLDLQARLPNARVVYCSATGVSEVANMAYMPRLGLWGVGTDFADFEAFLSAMRRRGMSFLEMLSIELKTEGLYVARGLSFAAAEFTELRCSLTNAQVVQYDAAAALWHDLRTALRRACKRTGAGRDVFKAYWASQQRFFKLLCMSLKLPAVVRAAKAALADGHCVVVGLQSTGEAALDSMGCAPGDACGWVCTLRLMLRQLVIQHFPVRYQHENESGALPSLPSEDPDCIDARTTLLQRIDSLHLPNNFLDALIDELGGPGAVAEMTGRKGRVVRNATGRVCYELRAKPDSGELDSLNVAQRDAFMRGQKLIAVISDAASTGISLHASCTAHNQRRRVHITVELPFSADKCIQQLGRTHRSNQASAPLYVLAVTTLGGEVRFAAAVARRLQSMGALTRGDRAAASGLDLSAYNLDSPLGQRALRTMGDAIVAEASALPRGVALQALLDGCDLTSLPVEAGVIDPDAVPALCMAIHQRLRGFLAVMDMGPNGDALEEGVVDGAPQPNKRKDGMGKDVNSVKRFLNRILGLPVANQNLLYNYFFATLHSEVRAAKAEGRFVDGVTELPGRSVRQVGAPVEVWVDALSGTTTYRNDLEVDRGMHFQEAMAKLQHSSAPRSGFRRSKRPMFGTTQVLLAIQQPGRGAQYAVYRPHTGLSAIEMDADELNSKYERQEAGSAEAAWTAMFDTSQTRCMHGEGCSNGSSCQVGRRLQRVTLLTGSVVRVWGALEMVLERNALALPRAERAMRVVRVALDDGRSLIGVRYPAALLPEVHVQLQAAQLQRHANLMQAQRDAHMAGRAAALGSGAAPAAGLQEAPTPVNPASLAKAMKKPSNIRDFFKPVGKQQQEQPDTEAAPKKATKTAPQLKHAGVQSFLVGAKRMREAGPALEDIKALKEMGFAEELARRVLAETNDLHRAVARLLANDDIH